MSLPLTTMLKDGQVYMQTWPMKKELYPLFPECRVISATRFSIKVMPALAVISAAAIINHFGPGHIPQAIAVAAFFISMPLQGMLWLGHRSNQVLPPAMQGWYKEIHYKMQVQGCALRETKANPKYMELARLLKTAFDELDRVFTKQWF